MAVTTNVPSDNFDDWRRDGQDLTRFVNQSSGSVTTRTGDNLTPLPVRDQQFQQALANVGYIYKDPDTFTTGATLNGPNEALRRASDGEYFRRVEGPYPYTVSPGTNPAADPLYVAVGSAALADRLADVDSTQLVGGVEAKNIGRRYKTTYYITDFTSLAVFATITAAFQAAANAAEGAALRVTKGVYPLVSQVNLPSNISIEFDPNAIIETSTPNISLFTASNKNNIKIKGGMFRSTVQGTVGTPSGILFNNVVNSEITDNKFEGMQLSSIYLVDSNDNLISKNYMSNNQGMTNPSADTCDIGILGNSSNNTITKNRCYSLSAIGILIQGSPALTLPIRNKVHLNYVNEKLGYGILAYQITSGDSWTQITNNHVHDISGSFVSGASGSGIYIQTSGGATVTGNHVRNCCRNTTSTLNAPAAISVICDQGTREASVVSNNHVDAPKYWGIVIGNANTKFICDGNVVSFSDPVNGAGIRLVNSSGSSITANQISSPTNVARSSIEVLAVDNDINGLVISNNPITGGNGIHINVSAATGRKISGSIAGNTCESSGPDSQGITLTRVDTVSLTGNVIATQFSGIFLTTSNANVRGSGNNLKRVGTNALLAGGGNVNCYFDASNDFDMTNTAGIQGESGIIVEQLSNAAPSGGTWGRGSRIQQSLPAVGSPKGWLCTVSGSPGTWVSEGNL